MVYALIESALIYTHCTDSGGCRIFFKGARTLYIKHNQEAKMSFFGYLIDILCMENFRFSGAIIGG